MSVFKCVAHFLANGSILAYNYLRNQEHKWSKFSFQAFRATKVVYGDLDSDAQKYLDLSLKCFAGPSMYLNLSVPKMNFSSKEFKKAPG